MLRPYIDHAPGPRFSVGIVAAGSVGFSPEDRPRGVMRMGRVDRLRLPVVALLVALWPACAAAQEVALAERGPRFLVAPEAPKAAPREIDASTNVLLRQVVSLNFDGPTVGRLLEARSEEHTSELQSRPHLVCRLLLEKK